MTLFRNDSAKSLNITIKPFTGVRVSIPQDLFTVFNLETKFQTSTHHLEMKVSDISTLRSVVRNNKISVAIPQSNKIADAEVQK